MRGIGEAENVDILWQALTQSSLGILQWRKEYTIQSDKFAAFYHRLQKRPAYLVKPPMFYRADIACPELRIDIEVNGSYHNTKRQRHKDTIRSSMLHEADWFVINVCEDDIPHRLGPFLDILRYTFENIAIGKTAYVIRQELIAGIP